MRSGLITLILLFSLNGFSQYSNKLDTIKLPQIIIGGDTLDEVTLPPVLVTASPLDPVKLSYRDQYYLRVVYPYALRIARLCQKIDQDLANCKNNRARNAYLNQTEKLLKQQFSKELKNLTVTQGRFLVKLVYRETGKSVFEIFKDYRGGFKTFFWVVGFKIWKIDIKDNYDPAGEDKDIENYVVRLDEIYQRDGTKFIINNEKFNIGIPGQKRQGD